MTAFADDPTLAEVTAATDRLLETLRSLGDDELAGPSLCPGWTRAHVAAHVARNADGLVNLLDWARTGVETPMYPSREARDAEIEAGAGRSSFDLEIDLTSSAERFLAACAELPEKALGVTVRLGSGREIPARDLPWTRLREVEIHHVDLDAGYGFARTPAWVLHRIADETAEMLAVRSAHGGHGIEARLVATDGDGREWTLGDAPAVTVTGPVASLVGWLTGRGDGSDLRAAGGPLPSVPAWS